MSEPIGDRLDALGIVANIEPDTLISGALVILHTVDSAGNSGVRHAWSEGMDWVVRRGLIETIRDAERITPDQTEEIE